MIAFFTQTTLGRGIGIALALLLYIQFQRHDAAGGAAAECKADYYKAENDKLTQRLLDAENLVQTNRTAADLATAENDKMEKERDAAVQDLRASQNECRKFTPDQRQRVRALKP